jgi:hypothetical protein
MPRWAWGLIVGGGLILAAIVVLVVVSIISIVAKRVESRQALQSLQVESESLRQEYLASFDSQATSGGQAEFLDRHVQNMERQVERMSGADATVLRATIAAFKDMRPSVIAYDNAGADVELDGGFDPAVFKAVKDIDRVVGRLKGLQAASVALAAQVRVLPDRFADELRQTGVSEANVGSALRGFRSGANIDRMLSTHQDDQDGCSVMIQMLNVLKREWNRWEFDVEQEGVVFDRDNAADEYNELAEKLSVIIERQMQTQRELLTTPLSGASGR